MENVIRKAWRIVEEDFRCERINSERCLQASLYRALRACLPITDIVLIEPAFEGFIPDIVVRDDCSIKCILELKCMPHWWVSKGKLDQDIQKLLSYSKHQNSNVVLEVFGPEQIFDVKAKEWRNGKPKFTVTANTWYGFVILTRHDDPATRIEHLRERNSELRNLSNFCFLSGTMNPDAIDADTRCVFKVEFQSSGPV